MQGKCGKKLKKGAKSGKKARKRCEKGAFWGREKAEGRGKMVEGRGREREPDTIRRNERSPDLVRE